MILMLFNEGDVGECSLFMGRAGLQMGEGGASEVYSPI